MTTAKHQLHALEKELKRLHDRRHEMTNPEYQRRRRALQKRMTPEMLREHTREMYEAEGKEPPREPHPKRRTSFRIFKDGGWVNASFDGTEVFVRPKTLGVPRLAPDRIAAIDTESLTVMKKRGRLTTVLVPFWFSNGSAMVEPMKGTTILEQVADVLLERFGVTHSEPDENGKRRRLGESRTKQRAKRYRGPGRGLSRDGTRETVPLSLLVFFNLEYDIQRIFADRPELLRSIGAGADAVFLNVSDRIVIEVRRLILQNGAHFEWMIRDRLAGRVARVVGIDCWQYWKCSLAAAAKSFPDLVTPKVDIEDQIEGVYEKPFEEFTEREWRLFRDVYALGDVQTTFELYEATVTTLMQIDPNVLRKGGIIPPSAPSASIRIMQSKAWTCHPELTEYRRYPAWADRWGCRAYYGGRSFAIRPGLHDELQVIDLVSAYAAALAGLPDPVTVHMEVVKPSRGFDVQAWRGLYGVLEVDGESTDDAAPPFRVHEDERLRYIAGKFERECLTVPEIVIGVLRGALRIDRIRGGVVMRRSKHDDRSYFLEGIREFFQLKEANEKGTALYAVAKLLLNGGYGKLYECNRGDFPIPIAVKMPHFAEGDQIANSIAVIYSRLGPLGGADKPLGGVYWGETDAQKRRAFDYYASELRAKPWMQGTARATAAVVSYVNALKRAKVRVEPERDKQGRALPSGKKLPDLSIRAFLRQHKRYTCGSHFSPLYASQITGLTSAKLGLMAACLDAHTVCGDTDSIAFKASQKIRATKDLAKLDGFRRYHELMDAAGYPSPRQERGKWVGIIAPGIERLGAWDLETPEPSVEAVVVRPKVYSLRFADGSFKQAFHSFAKYHSPEIDEILGDRSTSRDKRAKRAKQKRSELLHEHMRSMVEQNATVEYDTRPSPTRLRQWILSNSSASPATFETRHVKVKRTPIPHTTETADGVRWNKLSRDERHKRAEANAILATKQRFDDRRDQLGGSGEFANLRDSRTRVYDLTNGQRRRIA